MEDRGDSSFGSRETDREWLKAHFEASDGLAISELVP